MGPGRRFLGFCSAWTPVGPRFATACAGNCAGTGLSRAAVAFPSVWSGPAGLRRSDGCRSPMSCGCSRGARCAGRTEGRRRQTESVCARCRSARVLLQHGARCSSRGDRSRTIKDPRRGRSTMRRIIAGTESRPNLGLRLARAVVALVISQFEVCHPATSRHTSASFAGSRCARQPSSHAEEALHRSLTLHQSAAGSRSTTVRK